VQRRLFITLGSEYSAICNILLHVYARLYFVQSPVTWLALLGLYYCIYLLKITNDYYLALGFALPDHLPPPQKIPPPLSPKTILKGK